MKSTIIQSTTLFFRQGSSDKIYQAAIEEVTGDNDAFLVNFAYGRRGSTLKTGTKTQKPVTREKATTIFDKLITSKQAKGYSPGEDGTPYVGTGSENISTGIHCQLLNSIEEDEVSRLLTDSKHCLQEKFDGRRLLVKKQGSEIIGINRRGLAVALPETIRQAVADLPCDVLLDGEAIGDTLHVFDILEAAGEDLRQTRYLDRHATLLKLFPLGHPNNPWVSTAIDPNDKVAINEEHRLTGAEGLVFKDINAPYTPGRPNSGGPQLKFKFVETASFIVTGHNDKRSVTLGLNHTDTLQPAGNVSIPQNQTIPPINSVVEVRYLYAFRESGSIYQPFYLGTRDDIPADECSTTQLKYKAETITV